MNINLQIDDLRNNLVDIINESNLPIAIIELIVKDLYIKVQNQYIATINSERLKDMKSHEDLKQEINETIDRDEKELREVLAQNEQ